MFGRGITVHKSKNHPLSAQNVHPLYKKLEYVLMTRSIWGEGWGRHVMSHDIT
jgi:hypothetical protein